MPEQVDLSFLIGRDPEETIEYFRSKGYQISFDWWEVWEKAHAKSFTVAKAMQLDLLQDLRNAVDKAIADGETFQQFKQKLTPVLKARGWWGKQEVETPSGEKRVVQLGSPWRLKTIYNVNVRTSFSSGKFNRFIENAENRPWWMYVSLRDRRTRPAHRAMNGKVFRFDDPFWNKFFPPNGWNCRCTVRALSDRALQREGIKPEVSQGNIKITDEPVSQSTKETRPVANYIDPASGRVALKTDPGWSYNPGLAAFQPDLEAYQRFLRTKFIEYLNVSGNGAAWAKSAFTYGGSENIPDGFIQQFGPSVLPDQFFDRIGGKVKFKIRNDDRSLYLPQHKIVEIGINRRFEQSRQFTAWYKKRAAIHEYTHAFHRNVRWVDDRRVHPKIKKIFERAADEWNRFEGKSSFKSFKENGEPMIERMMRKFGKRYTRDQVFEFVADCFDTVAALTKRKYGAGHSVAYFSERNNGYKEFVAHSAEVFFQGNPVMREILPGVHDLMMKLWTDHFNGEL